MRLSPYTSTAQHATASGAGPRLSERRFVYSGFASLFIILAFLFPVCASASSQDSSAASDTLSASDTIGVKVYFRQGYSTLQPSFCDNGIRLEEFTRRISDMHLDSAEIRINSIDIVAFASPEGSYTLNKRLARKRASNISSYLQGNMPFVPDTLYNVQSRGIDWNGLTSMVEASEMLYRNEVLDILRNVPETTYRNGRLVDSRLKRLMDLRGGRPYWYLYENFFPQLRSAGACVICDNERIEPFTAHEAVETVEESVGEMAEVVEPIYIENYGNVVPFPTDTAQSQVRPFDLWAIKSNALYLAAGVANIGGEYAFHQHWSIDLPIVYSPYTIARKYRMRFLYVQPELRYWLGRPLKGHFFGLHLHAGVFNVSLNDRSRYQSEKGFHGAGISYGYVMPLSRRWSMEFTVGVGYAFTKYCAYYNVSNGIRYKKDIPYNYWGITKLGLNFEYRFGDKCGKFDNSCKKKGGKEVSI